jgi:hypothetical protein
MDTPYISLIVGGTIALFFMAYLTGSFILPLFFVFGYILSTLNIVNNEKRDDALLLSSQLTISIGLGLLVLILAYNSKFLMDNRFHFSLGLLFLLALPTVFMNIGISTISLSN